MPSIDNLLRTINEYMKDMFDTFGGQSQEYMAALKQVRENIPKNVLDQTVRSGLNYAGDKPTEPLQFSRGKASQEILSNYDTDISQLRKDQREQGTAQTQAQRYYEEQKQAGEQPTKQGAKERANERYYFNNSTNDWYSAIMESEYSTQEEKDITRMMYKELNLNYDDPAFREKLENWCINVLRNMRQREKATEKQAPESDIKGVGANLDDII